ncbi:NYN domain-containing protein [Humibacillus xanthopallidus]|uniref:NYN domain-containing protein n=1 Tax=Humibacillus xanthopallidus TaxID=412689 RepID=A0A543H8G0_9MICO|nr:NYN domain-containing protein [Humibacillus xanthopallidus]TQM54608.1 NYN domain-containing protein [Humibacillus xanthopallidus]
MRSHCALYVDVGYLLAASATRVTGTSLRSGVVVSYPDLVARLVAAAEEASGMPLLRVHWYDSGRRSGGAPDGAQEAIGMLPRVKLRLGRISPQGEQKGVDLRIGLDLAAHGRNRVVDVIYLVSGDDDLCEAVEEAQNHGVQVVLMAVPDRAGKPHAVSKHLIREADDLIVLDGSVVDDTVHVRQLQPEEAPVGSAAAAGAEGGTVVPLPGPRSSEAAATASAGSEPRPTPAMLAGQRPVARAADATGGSARPGSAASRPIWSSSSDGAGSRQTASTSASELELIDEVCRGVISAWSVTASADDRRRMLAERPYIPNDLDRALLLDLSARLGVYDVDEHLRYLLRDHFWEVLGSRPS